MSFITGAVGNGRSIAVLAQVDDANGNPLDAWRLGVWRDGSWRAEHSLDSQPVALCALQQGSDSWAVLASEGEVTLIEEAISAPRLRVEHVVEQVTIPIYNDPAICEWPGGYRHGQAGALVGRSSRLEAPRSEYAAGATRRTHRFRSACRGIRRTLRMWMVGRNLATEQQLLVSGCLTDQHHFDRCRSHGGARDRHMRSSRHAATGHAGQLVHCRS